MNQDLNKPSKPNDVSEHLGEGESPQVLQYLIGLIQIPRPINCAITFFSVLLGGWLGTLTLSNSLLLAAISATLITGGGNVLNDLCGLQEDRINKPQRPLPAGIVSSTTAIILTFFLLLGGLILGFLLPSPAPWIVLVAVIALIGYNFWLKRVPLLGNLVVSALGGLAFVYGGFAAHAYPPSRWPALFAVLFHLGREILKDLEDIPGDQVLMGSTIPLSWGKSTARILITGIYATLMILTPLPALIDIYGNIYFALACLLNLLLIYVLIRLRQASTPKILRHLNHTLKGGMILGLLAFFFDRL
jgi:geranylgeranylglycerol-phosphate geranylgeranyltransferase